MTTRQFELEIFLPLSAELLAADILSIRGVNFELFPFVRMTAPTDWKEKPISMWPVDTALFASFVLLFGFIPLDWHRFRFCSVGAEGFKESSSSFINRQWQHERMILSCDAGVTVKDSVAFESKIELLGAVLLPVYKAIFAYRHKRLASRYGSANWK